MFIYFDTYLLIFVYYTLRTIGRLHVHRLGLASRLCHVYMPGPLVVVPDHKCRNWFANSKLIPALFFSLGDIIAVRSLSHNFYIFH